MGYVLIDDQFADRPEVLELSNKEIWELISAACLYAKTRGESPAPRLPHLFRFKWSPCRINWGRSEIWRAEKGVCWLCREPVSFEDFHIEHMIPLARGGKDARSNIAIAHSHCNLIKGSRLLEELTDDHFTRMLAGAKVA